MLPPTPHPSLKGFSVAFDKPLLTWGTSAPPYTACEACGLFSLFPDDSPEFWPLSRACLWRRHHPLSHPLLVWKTKTKETGKPGLDFRMSPAVRRTIRNCSAGTEMGQDGHPDSSVNCIMACAQPTDKLQATQRPLAPWPAAPFLASDPSPEALCVPPARTVPLPGCRRPASELTHFHFSCLQKRGWRCGSL